MHKYYGIDRKKLLIIPNFVVDKKQSQSEESWKFGMKAIVTVGRLEPVKQQERIIRTFYYIIQREKQARLVILGKGSQLNYLKRLCRKYQIENEVIFIGFTNNVSYFLEHAKVFVMSSVVEGFPNSMIEAMNYGVPIVSTDSPGACREILGSALMKMDGRTYELCKYGILTPAISCSGLKADSGLSKQEIH